MSGTRAVVAALTLPGTERSAVRVRAFVRDVLGAGHPALDDVRACVNEAFTNGVEHTSSERISVVFVEVGDETLVEVADDGAAGSRPRLCEESLGEGGRGMRIIDALAREWGVRSEEGRAIVWMRFDRRSGK
ncbi:ATP-binding protein [Actinomadura sp. 9N407]|uniref:ATP-binding protein n=1 Tax=Actinomadura sp. 9N407 TaxID=3375154 RepID=UPI00378936BF